MHKAPDPRVDVCLYFVSPHRIKSIDVEFMAKLSAVVPVLPVLAKVDNARPALICAAATQTSSFAAKNCVGSELARSMRHSNGLMRTTASCKSASVREVGVAGGISAGP